MLHYTVRLKSTGTLILTMCKLYSGKTTFPLFPTAQLIDFTWGSTVIWILTFAKRSITVGGVVCVHLSVREDLREGSL